MLKTAVSAAMLAALTASIAVAADKPSPDSQSDKPDYRMGEEVDRICFARNINGWKEVEGVDNAVLLDSGARTWHYVTLSGACPSRLFRFANAIGIDNRPGGGCVRQGDAIIVADSGNFTQRCFIRRINKWDSKAKAPDADEPQASEESPSR